jgi:glycosyltransferase involved in cell wall biosynthesis
MKILAVSDFFPWPTTKGGLIRAATAVEALSKLGELDLFSFYDARIPFGDVPTDVRLVGLATTPYPRPSWSRRWKARSVLHRGVPLRVALRTYDPQPRVDFDAFAADRYDLVWFRSPATWEWLGRPRLGPTIVDLDVLDDNVERQRAGVAGAHGATGPPSPGDRLRASVKARVNAYDWRRFQLGVAEEVDRVVLCSDTDVDRFGTDNAVVVPNTYPEPDRAVGKPEAVDPPTVLLQATFDYAPNVDAAQWLVREVAPRIRSRLPGTKVRLAGLATPQVEALADPPAVTVTGFVPDMASELARADVVVVPLRIGSGTRLKILESFAHRVPVVSTTLGAEGLDVVDGVHLLLADTPESIAGACARLQGDPELRRRLVDAAQERYRERYAAAAARDRIRELVDSVARPGARCR